jgi:hypothetical protein
MWLFDILALFVMMQTDGQGILEVVSHHYLLSINYLCCSPSKDD